MKIYSMTATFGKLSHQTLTLKPGLNVISAPNEWGKSTWCAFLTAMLYGIDTRERTTQTALADKERFAPWSGEAMSGRIDLCWKGRDITIERRTKGRSIFGEFSAYETASGLPVPELTSGNCGQVLLGVEKSVFARSAFIRQADMPVTPDEALRRRLNALVTTGNESDTGDDLAQKLKDLKNRCRHNKTGLLPQAEGQQKALEEKLSQLNELNLQVKNIRQKQTQLETHLKELNNHAATLAYHAAQEGTARLHQAQAIQEEAQQAVTQLTARCEMLPSREFAAQQLTQLQQLQLQQKALEAELPPVPPTKPEAPHLFEDMSPAEALQQANSDKSAMDMLSKPVSLWLLILAGLSILACIGLAFVAWYAAIPLGLLAVFFTVCHIRNVNLQKRDRQAILDRYGQTPPEQWISLAQAYCDDMAKFSQGESAARAVSDAIARRKQELQQSLSILTQGQTPEFAIAKWEEVLSQHDALEKAKQVLRQAQSRVNDLSAVTKTPSPPEFSDSLTLSGQETAQAIADCTGEQQQLQMRLGQCLGQMESLGSEEALTRQLDAVTKRIAQLEDVYAAVTFAQQTLTTAANELQRRFAPRISQRAQVLFGKLTGNRYDRLQLAQDLSLHIGAVGEDTLRGSLWRSDGTVDQLYLALRLAVAEELIPESPLVLDDAFVRFDDTRLAEAMDILQEQSATRQILLFTCHGRESSFS